MKSIGKFNITITIMEDGKVKEEINKVRTVYSQKKNLFMFWKNNFIPLTQNGEQYFATWENKTVSSSSE